MYRDQFGEFVCGYGGLKEGNLCLTTPQESERAIKRLNSGLEFQTTNNKHEQVNGSSTIVLNGLPKRPNGL